MPWSGKSFAKKHNKKLAPIPAEHAAAQANAMLRAGVPEGMAIATANKHGNVMNRQMADRRSLKPRADFTSPMLRPIGGNQ